MPATCLQHAWTTQHAYNMPGPRNMPATCLDHATCLQHDAWTTQSFGSAAVHLCTLVLIVLCWNLLSIKAIHSTLLQMLLRERNRRAEFFNTLGVTPLLLLLQRHGHDPQLVYETVNNLWLLSYEPQLRPPLADIHVSSAAFRALCCYGVLLIYTGYALFAACWFVFNRH
jgi:hypothetical protein